MESSSHTLHLCVDLEGQGVDCPQCSLFRLDYCQVLVEVLKSTDRRWRSTIREPMDREEIVAEAVTTLMSQGGDCGSREHFRSMALRVLKFKRIDWYRKKAREREMSEDPAKAFRGFQVAGTTLTSLGRIAPPSVVDKLESLRDRVFETREKFSEAVRRCIGEEAFEKYHRDISKAAVYGSTDPRAALDETKGPERALREEIGKSERDMVNRIDMSVLLEKLRQGDPRCYDLVWKKEVERMSVKALAALYGEKSNTVTKRIGRCLKKLRHMIEEEGWR